MGVTFAGRECVDPRDVMIACAERRMPLGDWVGKATSFRTSIRTHGSGHLLMSRREVEGISKETPHELIFNDPNKTLTFKKVWIISAKCITPGYEESDDSVYHVEIADYRYFASMIPANATYNLRNSNGEYNTSTLNSGSAWTWSEILENLWEKLPEFGAYPGLPSGVSPHGTPNHFDYSSMSVWSALVHLCDRLAIAVVHNPFEDTYRLVRIGSTGPDSDATATWDEFPLDEDNAVEPKEIKTRFRVLPVATSSAPFFLKTTSRTVLTGMLDGTAVLLHDDYTTDNTADAVATSRATDRAGEWERVYVSDYATDRVRTLRALHDVVNQLASKLDSIIWRDFGEGWMTETISGNEKFLEEWKPCDLVMDGGGSPAESIIRSVVDRVTCDALGNIVSRYTLAYGPALPTPPTGSNVIEGTVTVDAVATAGREVVATYDGYEWRGTTNGSGDYTISDLPGGTYVVLVIPEAGEAGTIHQTVTVPTSPAMANFTLTT